MLRARMKVSTLVSAVTAVTLAVTLAACGSNLDPEEVQGLGSGGGTAQEGVVNPDGTVTGGDTSGGTTTGGDTSGGTTTGGTTRRDDRRHHRRYDGRHDGRDRRRRRRRRRAEGDGSATGGGKGASCDGFKNGPGITDSEIVIGNASDISGPVPGLFEAAQDATKAYVAYFNSTSDICGRKLG